MAPITRKEAGRPSARRRAVTFDDVRKVAHTLPGVEDGTSYGTPALKVRGKLFVRLHQDRDCFVLRAGILARGEPIEGIEMTCEECRDLQTHTFRSPADLLHALQVAAAEVDRGVLIRVNRDELTDVERDALESVLVSEALPDNVRYRFKCSVCGDLFELNAETYGGRGGWTRQERSDAL